MPMSESVYKFEAVLLKHPELDASYVIFPFNVLDCFGVKGQVKVKAVFNHSITYRGSLAKMGFDLHLLGITKEIRHQLGITFGDNIYVELMQDRETRQVEIPKDVQKFLDSNPEKAAFFHKLSFTHRKEYMRWIESSKKEETRQRRLAEFMDRIQLNLRPGEKPE